MREIKLRAWDKEKKEMFYHMETDSELALWILLHNKGAGIVIQLFIGLKDKNGKEIYEGDKVKTPFNPIDKKTKKPITYVVEFNEGRFVAQGYVEGKKIVSEYIILTSFEVIGNVTDNPELL